ncbi:lactococcin 972 family bacteriocin [Streptococcus ruminantium]|uniref:Lactococcin 972 family bacteriocin n=1 Tax=Streptococcus ruminantium TaxID=1917441 RepID=A0ABU1B3U1_9STRE|nr:lactococcin 972 family bacteriocin [Streptococcus ruminantium]MDQ8758858.1 lactococcin 972 family bacteriocin [Streptococcus ruminantium]MDQ8764800.1 lactococcin 972 family bacteriocin [Streptococcus ruminantium]MDQ8768226.1 lactococcin 972 family bacteriocin [Streptococcus ruminantium]MDQ8774695.1 lactococcin 972 family bacteriocin [Streptococcus ruminantium]MDQ8793592.1 lactococcin 972 family bacteriocin [Streptococcus ruminantium]
MSSLLTIMLTIPVVVLAVEVGGGYWNYGVGWTGTFGYSDYLHNSKPHRSAIKFDGQVVASSRAQPGVWAKSVYYRIPPTRMSYYWNTY